MSRSSRFSVDQASLLDALPDCVFVIDASGCVRYLNAAVERVLGWDPEMWIGRDVTEVVHVDDLPSVASSIQSLEAKVAGRRSRCGSWALTACGTGWRSSARTRCSIPKSQVWSASHVT